MAAIIQPNRHAHTIFITDLIPELFTFTTDLPIGHIKKEASLKHCNPIGIKMIVMIQAMPEKKLAMANSKPPKINQRIFPNVFILQMPFYIFCNSGQI